VQVHGNDVAREPEGGEDEAELPDLSQPDGRLQGIPGQVADARQQVGWRDLCDHPLSTTGQASRFSTYLQPIFGFVALLILGLAGLSVFIGRRLLVRRRRGI
ncbi:MAG TPA: hypothetical protein VET65_14845, partial [Candidatus Limnocylindrales bacterium]|nr:hypothetical protein [Candidatus Limnocylindrales bacterium]